LELPRRNAFVHTFNDAQQFLVRRLLRAPDASVGAASAPDDRRVSSSDPLTANT
jgi:hypothetical protein